MADWSRRNILRGCAARLGRRRGAAVPRPASSTATARRWPPPARRCRSASAPGSGAAASTPRAASRASSAATTTSRPSSRRSRRTRTRSACFSNFNCILDGKPNLVHWSGAWRPWPAAAPLEGRHRRRLDRARRRSTAWSPTTSATARASARSRSPAPASPSVSYSMRAGSTVNPSEVDPVGALPAPVRARVQGPEQGRVHARSDRHAAPERAVVGQGRPRRPDAQARQRRPARGSTSTSPRCARSSSSSASCSRSRRRPKPASCPRRPARAGIGPTWRGRRATHELMAELLVMALACNQTRVFNMALSQRRLEPAQGRRPGIAPRADPRGAGRPAARLPAEGDLLRRALDGSLRLDAEDAGRDQGRRRHAARPQPGARHSESNFAKIHSVDSLPMMRRRRGRRQMEVGPARRRQGRRRSRASA